MRRILITGVAGFIGTNLALKILASENEVEIVGIDNLNDYYDINLKKSRLNKKIEMDNRGSNKFLFIKLDISNASDINKLFDNFLFDYVINLAAQAGVRNSICNPSDYINSNIVGFYNILETCRNSYDESGNGVKHLIYASS